MLLLFYLITFTLTSVGSDRAPSIEVATNLDDLIEKLILINEVSKILLTKNTVHVDFFVPFPTYDFTRIPDIEKMIH